MDGEETEVLDLGGDVAVEEEIQTTDTGDGGQGSDTDTQRELSDVVEGDGKQPVNQVSPFTKYKADLAELKASKPEFVKDIQRAFGKIASIDKLGTTEQITQQLEAIGLHGGIEGLQTLADTAERAAQLDGLFESGDPSLIDGWSKDFPEGFSKLVFPSVDKLETLNPEQYEAGMSRAAGRFLEKYGTFGQIERLGAAIDPANKAAVDMYNELVKNIFSPLRGAASKQMTDPLAGERQKIAQERQKLQEGEQNQFKESVKKDVNTEVRSQISKQVSAMLKGKTVSERVLTNIETEISRQVNADPNYSKQVGAVFSKKDKDAAVKFIVSRAIAKAPTAIRTVLKELGVSGTAPKVAAKPAPSTGVATIPGVPKTSDVDFTRTDMATFVGTKFSHGTAWLKNGKQAKW